MDKEKCYYNGDTFNIDICLSSCSDVKCELQALICAKKSLENKIWYTKKSRIYAAERIKKSSIRVQILSVFYSVIVIGLSIWNIYPNEQADKLSVFLLVASIALSFFSIFTSSMNYQERYINLKINYNNLEKLYLDLNGTPIKHLNLDLLRSINEKYVAELNSVENHTDLDFIMFKFYNSKDEKNKLNINDWVQLIVHSLMIASIWLLTIGTPILLTILLFRGGI